jgi:hypothetical protein
MFNDVFVAPRQKELMKLKKDEAFNPDEIIGRPTLV